MEYHRYRGNDILWVLYGLAECTCLILFVQRFCYIWGLTQNWQVLAAAGCGLLLFLISFFLLRALTGIGKPGRAHAVKIRKKREQRIQFWEYLFLVLISAGMAVFRVWITGGADSFLHPLIYVQRETILAVQTVLCLLTELLLYFALRMLTGRIAAVFVTTCVSLMPFYAGNSIYGAESTNLYLLLCALSLCLTACLFRGMCKQRRAVWPIVLLLGFFGGVLAAGDVVFVSTLLVTFWGIYCLKGAETDRERTPAAFACLGAAVCGFAAFLIVILLAFDRMPGAFFRSWASGFLQASFWNLGEAATVEYFAPMLACLGFHFFSLFALPGRKRDKTDQAGLWLPSYLLLMVFFLFGKTSAAQEMVVLLYWLILAGAGMQTVFSSASLQREGMRREKEEEDPSAQPLRPGEAIPNPLPVPKRHTPRQMGYAFEPEEHEMHYDLEQLDENDDFELL